MKCFKHYDLSDYFGTISKKRASKQAYSIKTTSRHWKMKWDERWINSMKWKWFKVPVKVEQINEFSDTVQSKKKKKVAVMKWAKGNEMKDE